jgi:hypothetical protein
LSFAKLNNEAICSLKLSKTTSAPIEFIPTDYVVIVTDIVNDVVVMKSGFK